MGRLAVVSLIWILAFALVLVLIDSQLTQNLVEDGPNGVDTQGHGDPNTGSGNVSLYVDGYVTGGVWQRGTDDLPTFNVAVSYVVQNRGNITAEMLTVWLLVGSHRYSSQTFRDLRPGSEQGDAFSALIEYDQEVMVGIEAICGNAASRWSQTVDVELPRSPAWPISCLFVTPE